MGNMAVSTGFMKFYSFFTLAATTDCQLEHIRCTRGTLREGAGARGSEMLRCAQHDKGVLSMTGCKQHDGLRSSQAKESMARCFAALSMTG